MLLAAMLRAFQDIPNGWATVGAAVIDVGGPVAVTAVLGLMAWVLRRLKHIQVDTQKTVAHVANEHTDDEGNPINLRDDLDGKQDETRDLLTEALDKLAQIQRVQVEQAEVQRGQARDIGGIRAELRTLHENDAEQVRQANRDREQAQKDRDHLAELERTIPRDALGRFTSKGRSDG